MVATNFTPEVMAKTQAEISFGVLELELTPTGTVLVKKVDKFSSAGKAGIVSGDQIVLFGGEKPSSPQRSWAIMAEAGVGGTIPVTVLRAGKEIEISMTLLKKRNLDFELDEVDPALERKIAP